jgi:hypothetical protein
MVLTYLLPVPAGGDVQGQGTAFVNFSLTGLLPGLALEITFDAFSFSFALCACRSVKATTVELEVVDVAGSIFAFVDGHDCRSFCLRMKLLMLWPTILRLGRFFVVPTFTVRMRPPIT